MLACSSRAATRAAWRAASCLRRASIRLACSRRRCSIRIAWSSASFSITSGVSLLRAAESSGRARSRDTSDHMLLVFLVPSPSYLSSSAMFVQTVAADFLRRSSSSPPEVLSSENLNDDAMSPHLAAERLEYMSEREESPPVGETSGGIGKLPLRKYGDISSPRLASSGLLCLSQEGSLALASFSSGTSREGGCLKS